MSSNEVVTVAVTRRPRGARAINYTGKNGKDVVKFLKSISDEYELDLIIRNGGSYISVSYQDGAEYRKVLKGDWIVLEADGSITLPLRQSTFEMFYTLKK